MRKVNVLHVIPALGFGGAERQVVTLAAGLDRCRYAPTVCCMRKSGPLAEALAERDVDVIVLGWRTRYLPVSLLRLVRLMRSRRVDIVHTHLFDGGLWGRLAARLAGVPIIVHTEQGLNPWKRRRHIWYERFADRFTDRRIAVSEDIRCSRIRRESLDPAKLVVIHNSIDLAYFDLATIEDPAVAREALRLNGSQPLVGTVARLSHEKDIATFIEAAARVGACIADVRFVIVGDGPLRRDLEGLTGKLGLRERVIFTGARPDVRELLATMDVFVLPSLREGISVSLLEAMAMERPVVATAVGGTPEIIQDSGAGLLVPPRDTQALAEAITSLLRDPQRRARLGAAARERVREAFSAEACVAQVERLYEELLERVR